jgi:hypothetical protein
MPLQIFDAAPGRELREERIAGDLTIVGGGLAGTCTAIAAARQGLKVTLIQDRPVLGGNCSSEVRLWVLGATSHMNNNNRFAREGGVVDEILTENLWRNREGNPLIVDTILLEKVAEEPNIRLLLNTSVFEATKDKADPDRIAGVRAFCSQNGTMYCVQSPLFVDASGDGVLGFLAGAAFRIGAEPTEEFGESLAPSEEYGHLLGHSIYFYSKDVGRPIDFVAPSYAKKDVATLERWKRYNLNVQGCRLWWIEYGGRLDTVHQTEEIKWELWRVVYGLWDHVKNSGEFPEAANHTLEWVGTIPGKRESRRFEGEYMLTQNDLATTRRFDDAVAFGGWAIDLHPADGVYSDKPGCSQFHVRGVYQIPYRCLYSRNVANLFLAGRLISASHVAFGSTRVMGTSAHAGQAVAHAAALCLRHDVEPQDVPTNELQTSLLRDAQHIPHVPLRDDDDLVQQATLDASSTLTLDALPPSEAEDRRDLSRPFGLLLHLPAGRVPTMTLQLQGDGEATAELRTSERSGLHDARRVLASGTISPKNGRIDFGVTLAKPASVVLVLTGTEALRVRTTAHRLTGFVPIGDRFEPAAEAEAKHPGLADVPLFPPLRRPHRGPAIAFDPPLNHFGTANLTNGLFRPGDGTNAWLASPADATPTLICRWPKPQTIGRIDLHFDTDFDHALESVLLGHPERVAPTCVQNFRLVGIDANGHETLLIERDANRQSHVVVPTNGTYQALRLTLHHPSPQVPAALFAIRCYANQNAGPLPGRGFAVGAMSAPPARSDP